MSVSGAPAEPGRGYDGAVPPDGLVASSAEQRAVELPATVAVMGSCMTRDNFNSRFNPDYKRWYECPLHQNQSALPALMSEPLDVEWAPTKNLSDYDLWNVRTDFTRSFLDEVVALQPDYLILDFFGDIHFGCLVLDDGRLITNNRWKSRHTDFVQRMLEEGRARPLSIVDDTDEYLALWRSSYDRFDAYVREHLPRTTVVVHRGQNTDRLLLSDRPRPVRLQRHRKISRLDVPRTNELWSVLDDYAVATSGAAQIDLTRTGVATYDEHPWGPFYVHFTPDYYEAFLAELHAIHLARSSPADLHDMLAHIDRSHRARLAASQQRAETAEQQVRRLRARVRELDGAQAGGPDSLGARVRGRLSRRRAR